MGLEYIKHINTAIISRSPRSSFGYMYKMHRYWSKKSPDVISQYIRNYTNPGEIIIDPFCGSGIVISEAIRLGRKAVGIELNPMAYFITKMTLLPINLSNLYWSFMDIKENCKEEIYELFTTKCDKCGKNAIVDFYVKEKELTRLIAYKCRCSKKRLYKSPTKRDLNLDKKISQKEVPFWYPKDIHLPIIRKEKIRYLHELFTRRNLISLSIILNSINKIEDEKVNQMMKLAFTSALDKCSKLKPLSYKNRKKGSLPNLQESWVANRFYMPKNWLEVNPWQAFERSFNIVYKGKKESNEKLKYASSGSSFKDLINSQANYIIYNGSAEDIIKKYISSSTVHYVLTDPPFIGNIQYLALSTFWGAWLKFSFNYDKELIVNKFRNKMIKDYNNHLNVIFKTIINVLIPGRYIHIFYEDVRGPYLHNLLRLLIGSKILPEKILDQPPVVSFIKSKKVASKYTSKSNYGSFIIRGKFSKQKPICLDEKYLRERILKITQRTLEFRGGETNKAALYKSLYNSLNGREIQTISKYNIDELIKESLGDSFIIKGYEIKEKGFSDISNNNKKIEERVKLAILNAKSLDSSLRNQYYQRVLIKFQQEGITIDDIRLIADKIDEKDAKKYRRGRLLNLLKSLGKKLKYEVILNKRIGEVTWNKGKKQVLFIIKDDEIEIKASSTEFQKQMFDVGTITDERLESSLREWCKNKPNISGDLEKELNPIPMNEIDSTSNSFKILRLKVVSNKEICDKHYLIKLECLSNKSLEKINPGQFFHIICDPSKYMLLTERNKRKNYTIYKKNLLKILSPNELKEINKNFSKRDLLTLRRPFSAHRIYYKNFERKLLDSPIIIPDELKANIRRNIESFDILYKDVGRGTKNLSRIKSGSINAIGPIGNGFNIKNIETAIIVAGGIGAAPLVALAEELRYHGIDIYIYLGAKKREIYKYLKKVLLRFDTVIEKGYEDGRNKLLNIIKEEFSEIGVEKNKIKICSDDKSVGEEGPVSEIFERDIKGNIFEIFPKSSIAIYTCGPSEMIREVSRIAAENNIPCQVLLEERMACGIGACYSCTCNIENEKGEKIKKRVCLDGPVFESKEIIWKS